MSHSDNEIITEELPILRPIGSFPSGPNDLDLTDIRITPARFGDFATIPAYGGGVRICPVLDSLDETEVYELAGPIGYVRKIQAVEVSHGGDRTEQFIPVCQVRLNVTDPWGEIPNFADVVEAATALWFIHQWALAGKEDGMRVLSVKAVNVQIGRIWPGTNQEPQRYRLAVLWRYVMNNYGLTPTE